MGYIMVFDTETTGLDKPFCYDIGYIVMDTETGDFVDMQSYVIEQNWHNLPLFESAYYKDKRPRYVDMMRRREAVLIKWGYAMQKIRQTLRKYEITDVYAYNSDFDDKVFTFNCDWFKTTNPLENVAVHDIWGYASQFITNKPDYKTFCETHERFTDSGNYKGSAEVVYQYLSDNPEFIEEHMGLFDSEIEAKILYACVSELGASWSEDYKVTKIINRIVTHPFQVKVDGEEIYSGEYVTKYVRNGLYSFKTTT